MRTREFTREELECFGIPYSWDAEPGQAAERLHEEQVDTRRWVSVHEVVFRAPDDGQVWSVTYVKGLTESQDGTDPWGYEGSTVRATAMVAHTETVTRWRPAT